MVCSIEYKFYAQKCHSVTLHYCIHFEHKLKCIRKTITNIARVPADLSRPFQYEWTCMPQAETAWAECSRQVDVPDAFKHQWNVETGTRELSRYSLCHEHEATHYR